ncbi:MAG TPA: hypothetical protein VIL92_10635 [Gaiellaceae bacterium]
MELVDDAALTHGGTEPASDRPAPVSAAPVEATVVDGFEEDEIDALPLVGDDGEDESLFEGWA